MAVDSDFIPNYKKGFFTGLGTITAYAAAYAFLYFYINPRIEKAEQRQQAQQARQQINLQYGAQAQIVRPQLQGSSCANPWS